ncbi:MAG: hypothetical protein IT542_12370 [Rubellimicrobium sp.]|nr:hypothetical protein [Rubellimicrobium sp.]
MSLAFILYCLWIAAAAAIPLAPAARRPVLRFAVLCGGLVPVALAALTVGLVPAALALCGVVALFPAPVAALVQAGLAALRVRIRQIRAARHA